MTPKQIADMLVSISSNIPVFYDHADIGTKAPFIEWTFSSSDNFSADNRTYQEVFDVRACLYTIRKDYASEELIKQTLTANDVPFSHEENYIDDEQVFQEIYTFSVIDSTTN